jgi:hypothetical protein
MLLFFKTKSVMNFVEGDLSSTSIRKVIEPIGKIHCLSRLLPFVIIRKSSLKW